MKQAHVFVFIHVSNNEAAVSLDAYYIYNTNRNCIDLLCYYSTIDVMTYYVIIT